MTHPELPSALVIELRQLTRHELSRPSQLRYVVLLLCAATMTIIATALLLTETALPRRTVVALALVALIGVSWTAFASWVLSCRRPLLGRHRVVAGGLAVMFSGAFAVGAAALGVLTASSVSWAAAAMGLVMLLAALVMFGRARRRFARLSKRREELTQLLRTK